MTAPHQNLPPKGVVLLKCESPATLRRNHRYPETVWCNEIVGMLPQTFTDSTIATVNCGRYSMLLLERMVESR
jgi:hypothetical protein